MTEVEVVMKKKMTVEQYRALIEAARKKGWSIQAYEVGYYNDGLKKKME